MEYLGWLLVGLLVGGGVTFAVSRRLLCISGVADGHVSVSSLLRKHFQPVKPDDITIAERQFPYRVRADLQRAVDRLFGKETQVLHFCGVRSEFSHEGITLSGCIVPSQHYPTVSIPPEYEEIDVGEDEPVRVLKNGLWLLESGGTRFAVLLSPAGHYGQVTGVQFHVGVPNSADGTRITREFFRHLGRVDPEGGIVPRKNPLLGAAGALVFRAIKRHHSPPPSIR